jgi:hypothetical protein
MSRKRRRRSGRPPAGRKSKRATTFSSLAIPIVVGVVVLAVIVGAILSIERPAQGAGSQVVATAQAQPAQLPPYPDVPRISLEETQAKLEAGTAVLVDVRSEDSFNRSHASGALSIPEAEVDARLDELPRDKELVLY